MKKSPSRQSSAALVVSFVALLVALGNVSYAAFSLPKDSVGANQLKSGAVTTSKIKNGAVTTSKIKDGAVTTSKIKDGAVSSSKINTSGLTVPAALIGESPLAWAEVSPSGAVLAGNGVSSANITNKFAAYCFHGLGFAFNSASVTGVYDGNGTPTAAVSAQFATGDPFGDCSSIGVPRAQGQVVTSAGTAYAPEAFFIQFFN